MYATTMMTAFVAALLTGQTLAGDLTKPALRGGMDDFQPGLKKYLTTKQATVTEKPGKIAEGCVERIKEEKLDIMDVDTYEVKYEDCDQPWYICVHKDAKNQTIDQAVENFGKVPVRMRQWVKDVTIVDDKATNAYALGNRIVMKGAPNVATYIHEVTHCVDGGHGFKVNSGLSESKVWLDAYEKDSAVPDNYAQSNQAENVAQFPQIILTDLYVPGGSVALEENIDRVANQVRVAKEQGDNSPAKKSPDMYGQDGTCTHRYEVGKLVNKDGTEEDEDKPSCNGNSKRSKAFRRNLAEQKKRYAEAGIEMLDERAIFANRVMKRTECAGHI